MRSLRMQLLATIVKRKMMMTDAFDRDRIIQWLLEGDVSIQYQSTRDLLDETDREMQNRIAEEGWGAAFLNLRNENRHWGRGFYQPKWISTHYTLLDLKNLNISPDQPEIRETLNTVLRENKSMDGGMNPCVTIRNSDVCVSGMVLNVAAYFGMDDDALKSIVDFLFSQWMKDGGFNCHSNHVGAVHSSLHTTISVAEGIHEYLKNGYAYRAAELRKAENGCREFMLLHRLYKSDRTGDVIDKRMAMFSYPCRWRYDILRALDYFQTAHVDYDSRMDDAISILLKKRRVDGTWPVQAKHPGRTHFDMEKSGEPSRWNTLRALRVLRIYKPERRF